MWIKIIAIGIATYVCYNYFKKFSRKLKLVNAIPGSKGHYLFGNILDLIRRPVSGKAQFFISASS